MSGRPSLADLARVLRAALGRRKRPFITPGQGQAIRGQRTYSPPPLQDPDGGRRGD